MADVISITGQISLTAGPYECSHFVLMVSDLDILRCASLMIRQHGEEAAIFAAQRADALLDKGDHEGKKVWTNIVAAIAGLQGHPLQFDSLH